MTSATRSEDGVIHGPQRDVQLPSESLGRVLLRKFVSLGDSEAQVFPLHGRLTVTYRELSVRAARVSLDLQRRGLRIGDVLVVATGVVPVFTPLMVGAIARGVVLAPINPAYDVNDLRKLVRDTFQPRLILAESGAVSKIQSACPDVEVVDLVDFERRLEQIEVPLDSAGRVDVDKVCAADTPGWEDRLAFIMCSSGTTGLPKGVMLANGSFLYQLVVSSETDLKMDVGTTGLQYTPFFWYSGVFMQMISLFNGGRLVVLPRFEEKTMVETVQQYKVSYLFLAPHSAVALWKADASFDLSSLRRLFMGGSTMDGPTKRLVEQALRVQVHQWYGMTELQIVVGSSGQGDVPNGSLGRVHCNVEAKVVDPETGKVLGPNEEGEMWFRSPRVTKGYYRRPDATAQALDPDGWFHSGDMGYYDENLFFYFTERLKDLIKYRGHHVAPSTLEALLLSHPAVKEAAVVGVPRLLDQEWPRAYVVLKKGASVSEEELRQLVDGQVADFKKLRGGVCFVDALPKTATGKTSRRDLRNRAKEETVTTS